MTNLIKLLTNDQLTELEATIFLLIDSGLSYREVGTRLQLDHTQVMRTYKRAKDKKIVEKIARYSV
jgi:DNA-directed RNA polymerase specialized sigma24 family protein